MLHFVICDDEEAQLTLLKQSLKEWAAKRKCEVDVRTCKNAEQVLFLQEEKSRTDILLLDIDMPGMDGISLARSLREKGESIQIIFITGLIDYALEGYDVEALSYLVKPVDRQRFFDCLDRAVERCEKGESMLLLEMAGGVARVRLKSVCYLESDVHDTQVYCVGAQGASVQAVRCRLGIRQLEERLKGMSGAFFKIHRSYLVNLAYISRISRKEVVMDTGERLPVARGRWEELNRAYLAYYRKNAL